jgi:DNA-binding Lrp family transcriptional regulator
MPTMNNKKENMRRMPTAYVLLTTEIGAEKHVLNALKRIEGVQEVHHLWGVYDILAHIKAEDMDTLKQIIKTHIERIDKVNSKLTMIINESHMPTLDEHVMLDQNALIQ